MAKTFDATLNTLIDAHVGDWAAFLAARAGVPPGPVAVLDTDLSITLQADRLFRIDGPTVLHLELESTGRLGIPGELLRYNVAAWGVTELPVCSVLVLLRPKATATDLTGTLNLPAGGGQPYLTFRYTVIRVWQESVDVLLAAGLGVAPLALLTNEADRDLPTAFAGLGGTSPRFPPRPPRRSGGEPPPGSPRAPLAVPGGEPPPGSPRAPLPFFGTTRGPRPFRIAWNAGCWVRRSCCVGCATPRRGSKHFTGI